MTRPYFPPKSNDAIQLEAFVDAYGMRAVLDMLSHVCDEKASHLATNWQDVSAATLWERAGIACKNCANGPRVVAVSL